MATVIDIPFDKGVNLLEDPRRLEDGELLEAKNMVPWEPGILSMRPAGKIEFPLFIEDTATVFPLSLHPIPFDEADGDFIVATRNVAGNVNTRLRLGYMANSVGASLPTQSMGAITRIQPAVIAYNGVMYAFGGYPCPTAGYTFQGSGPGTYAFAEFAFGGTGNETIRPSVVGLYRDRFVYGDLGPGYESSLLMADRFLPASVKNNALAANGGYFDVNPNDGDRIVAVTEITQTAVASPSQGACLVLKNRSAFILTGEPAESGGTFSFEDFTVNALSYECGCASAATLCKTPYGWFWAGPDDVWFFATGQVPVRVGTKIRKALERTPAAARYKWHAAYFNGFYRLSIAAEGQGPTDDSPMQEQFWLDLRNGPPANFREARWWGPMGYRFVTPGAANISPTQVNGTYTLALYNKASQDQQLLGLVDGYAAATQTYVYLTSFDTAEGSDSTLGYNTTDLWQALTAYTVGTVVSTTSGLTYMCLTNGTSGSDEPTEMTGYVMDGSTDWRYIGPSNFISACDTATYQGVITCRIKTKVYDFGEPMIRKIFSGGEVDLFTSHACRLEWKAYLDNGQTISQNNIVDIPSTPAEFGVDVYDTGVFAEEFQSIALHPSAEERFIGKLVQLEITNTTTPKYPIIEGFNDQLVIGSIDGFGDFELPILYTLQAGDAWPSIDAFLSELQLGFQTLTGLAFTTQRTDNGVVEVVPPSGFRFVLAVDDASVATAGGDVSRVRRASAMLGFDRFTQYFPSLQDQSTVGTSPVSYYAHTTWQIGGLKLRIQPINRRPT